MTFDAGYTGKKFKRIIKNFGNLIWLRKQQISDYNVCFINVILTYLSIDTIIPMPVLGLMCPRQVVLILQ